MSVFPQPVLTFAHLSDPHIRPAGDPLVGGRVDSRGMLDRALDVLTSWDHDCAAWLFSGDLADDGDPEAYDWLRERVGAAASARGVQVIWANGNHDDRTAFRSRLLGEPPSDEPYNAERRLGGLRVLLLDTNLPGHPEGRVSASSLEWLGDRLADPAAPETLLVMHHTPLPPLQAAAGLWPLQNPDEVAAVVRGSCVRLILGGHFHQASHGTFAGIPVSGATSLSYTQDLTEGRTLRGQDAGQGFSLVQVFPDQVASSVVGLATGPLVHQRFTPADADRLSRQRGRG